MLTSGIFNTQWCHSVGEPCNFMDSLCFIFCLADVIANAFGKLDVVSRCYCHVCNLCFVLASVIASLFMTDGNVAAIWLIFVLAHVIAICFCGCWYYDFDHQLYQKVYHFLNTDVLRLPSSSGVIKMSRNDTFTIIKKEDKNSFLEHLNSIHQNIKFTCEEVRDDGSMPFFDILITPKEDGSLITSVFRKPTHTDLYLQLDGHHTISSKYSVAGTLYHKAKIIGHDTQLLKKEEGPSVPSPP